MLFHICRHWKPTIIFKTFTTGEITLVFKLRNNDDDKHIRTSFLINVGKL